MPVELIVFLICAGIGAFVGIAAGLLGIGGGLIVVPALYYLLPKFGIESAVVMHLALGTSMASIMFTALSSVNSHHKLGNVQWSLVKILAIGIAVGSLCGALLADALQEAELKRLFAFCVFVLAIFMFLNRTSTQGRALPPLPLLVIMGVVVGTLASLMGLGGGLILIPLLHYMGLEMRKAIGCGAACGLVASITGTIGYVGVGVDHQFLPEFAVGYVYLPALFGIVATSAIFAPFGAKLASRLEVALLKKIFAFILMLVGLNMAVF